MPAAHHVVHPRPDHTTLPLTGPGTDRDTVRAHLAGAEPRTLLMSLVHLGGGPAVLREFAPLCVPGADPDTVAPLAEQVRARVLDLLTGVTAPARPAPAGTPGTAAGLPYDLFREMAATYFGEPVDDEFTPLLLEQCGFSPREGVDPETRPTPPDGYHVAVIGAGLSGLAAGVKLAEAGYSFRLYDRNPDVGGTWLTNRYPGVGVDTPSHFYSFSFEINPDWPAFYSNGGVVLDYLRRCADGYGLREHTSFDTEVTSCVYDEALRRWQVVSRTAGGEPRVEWADAVISAMGFFQAPMHPDIPGLADFTGPVVHTAAWDPDIDLTGRRVGIIGTGASAMQVAPTIVDDVAHLTVFQRQPSWIMPRRATDLTVSDGARWAMRHLPYYAEWFRALTYWFASDGNHAKVVVDPEWTRPDVSVSAVNEDVRQWLLDYADAELADRPDLLAKAIPAYPPFGKRILRDNDWYRMLRRDDVVLETTPIGHIDASGVAIAEGDPVELDVLILATGYHMLPMLRSIEVTGRNGAVLSDVWGKEDPRAHRGVTVPGFPNFFVLAGPNSGAAHGAGANIISEVQINYVLGCLALLHTEGATAIEPTVEAYESYAEAVDAALDLTVWSHPTVRGYYRNSTGRVIVSNPWRLVDYWHMMRGPRRDEYDLK